MCMTMVTWLKRGQRKILNLNVRMWRFVNCFHFLALVLAQSRLAASHSESQFPYLSNKDNLK